MPEPVGWDSRNILPATYLFCAGLRKLPAIQPSSEQSFQNWGSPSPSFVDYNTYSDDPALSSSMCSS